MNILCFTLKSAEYLNSTKLVYYKNVISNPAQAFATILAQNVFEIDFNMNLSFSFTSIQSTQVKMQKNHINFILSCRIVITELSILHVIYDDMNNFLWRLSLTNGCNLKCIFMQTHFSTFASCFRCAHVTQQCRILYFIYFSNRASRRDSQLNLCSVNAFMQKGFYCHL